MAGAPPRAETKEAAPAVLREPATLSPAGASRAGIHMCLGRAERGARPGLAVTFVARVHSLRQQHAAQLALGALLAWDLDEVRRHAERVVVDLALMAPPDTAEGTRSGLGFCWRGCPMLVPCPPELAVTSQQPFHLVYRRPRTVDPAPTLP